MDYKGKLGDLSKKAGQFTMCEFCSSASYQNMSDQLSNLSMAVCRIISSTEGEDREYATQVANYIGRLQQICLDCNPETKSGKCEMNDYRKQAAEKPRVPTAV